ncbi:MAG: NirD/YgiW/YdeI family stress tolerance protein [Zoogloeaceae bacterium]|nr:NirD/YgiW/YdeI family stress tolerance protein [Zoogloeaceae bacterium]
MKLAKIALLVVPVLMFSSTKVAAQYLGPGAQAPSQSVAAALSAKDDSLVDISGYIIKQLTHEKYIFSDGKDQVRIEIDRDIFPNHGINEKTRVRIRGEVEKDFLESPEIDVESIDIL